MTGDAMRFILIIWQSCTVAGNGVLNSSQFLYPKRNPIYKLGLRATYDVALNMGKIMCNKCNAAGDAMSWLTFFLLPTQSFDVITDKNNIISLSDQYMGRWQV